MKNFRSLLLVLVIGISSSGPASAGMLELLSNGNFEAGSFAGWTQASDGEGVWLIDSPGNSTPISGLSTQGGASNGNFYAVSDQAGPSAQALVQSFTVPENFMSLELTFDMFVNNEAFNSIINPAGLVLDAGPNQHARVDILSAGATLFSTEAADVSSNLYLGTDLQPNPNPFTSYAIDLSDLVGGTTYQIRFANVSNVTFLNLGVDNVSILAQVIPEPTSWGLWSIGIACMGFVRTRHRPLLAFRS